MAEKEPASRRRPGSLSRESIIRASIELLDSEGEGGLTFPALSRKLATGPGAIYWHIDNKGALLIAACDAIVAPAITPRRAASPEAAIRDVALGLFDAINAHPWVGSTLMRAPGQSPAIRILEAIGQPVAALGVPDEKQWSAVSALLSYIVGIAGQNAANAQYARAHSLNRLDFLTEVSNEWSELDSQIYPFSSGIAARMLTHDDREDFMVGIDLILSGLATLYNL
jgi:AcrR family transcriptional regulator